MLKNFVTAKILITKENNLSLEIASGEGRIAIYSEITDDIEKLTRFAEAINEGDVSPIHIEELIEDFIG